MGYSTFTGILYRVFGVSRAPKMLEIRKKVQKMSFTSVLLVN